MIDTAEQQEHINKLEQAYKLYDERYDAYQEAFWAEKHIKPGYMSKNDSLYYLWLINKLKKHIDNLEGAINTISYSLVEPRCEEEKWCNIAKEECLKMIQEYLNEKGEHITIISVYPRKGQQT